MWERWCLCRLTGPGGVTSDSSDTEPGVTEQCEQAEWAEEIHLLFSMLRWWWSKLHAFIPGVRNKLSSYFTTSALEHYHRHHHLKNAWLAEAETRTFLWWCLETHLFPLMKSWIKRTSQVQDILAYYWDKNNNYSHFIVQFSRFLFIHCQLSCQMILCWKSDSGPWYGSEEWRHPAWNQWQWMDRMGGDIRGRCNVVIMLPCSPGSCYAWDGLRGGYQSVIHSYYVLGDTPDRPGLMVINWMWMMKLQFKFVISSFKVAWRWHIYLFAQWKRSNNIKCWKVYTKQDYTYTRSIIFIYLQKRIPPSLVKCLEWIWLLCCASGSL